MRAAEALAALEALPLAGIEEVLGGATALVLAPHPDDESLGCGGLIATCCALGRPPLVVIVTDGAGSHPGSRTHPPSRLRELRAAEARDATTLLGLPQDRLRFLGLPDAAAPREGPAFAAAVARLHALAVAGGCGVVVAPWLHDPHCDHEAVQLMARALARHAGLALLSYPVWGWLLPQDTEIAEPPARPGAPGGWRLDIGGQLGRKRAAIAAHVSQGSKMIIDDPGGFHLPDALLRVCDRPYEVYLRGA